ncbi:hypothetical protein EMCRGX_G028624 [Ephydatia muelleri]
MSMCTGSSGYQPTQLVELLHNVARFKSAWGSSDFNLTLRYAQSVVVWACGPLLLFICFGVMLATFLSCLHCTRAGKPLSKQVTRMCAAGLFVITAICLSSIGTSVWADLSLDGRIQRFLKEIYGISNLDTQAINESNRFDGRSTTNALNVLWESIYDSGNQTHTLMATEKLINETEILWLMLSDINHTLQFFSLDVIKDSVNKVEIVRHWTVLVNIMTSVLQVPLVLIALVSTKRLCAVIALLGLLLLISILLITSGGSLAIVIADICHDPDGVIKNYTPLSISDVVNYFLSCDGSCENPFSMDLVIRSAKYLLIRRSLQAQAALDIVMNNLHTSFNIVKHVSQLLNCTYVHQRYTSMQAILCNQAMTDATVGFLLITMAAVCAVTFFTCGSIGIVLRKYRTNRLIRFGSSLLAASYQALDTQPSKSFEHSAKNKMKDLTFTIRCRTNDVITPVMVVNKIWLLCPLVALLAKCLAVRVDTMLLTRLFPEVSSQFFDVSLRVRLNGAGFHRTLSVTAIKSDRNATLPSFVPIRFLLHITRDVYVDVDQLNALEERGGPQMTVSAHMDTEQAAIHSSDHWLLLSGVMDTPLSLPFHLRYQSPSTLAYKTITLPFPQLFVQCSNITANDLWPPSCNDDQLCDETWCSWVQVPVRPDVLLLDVPYILLLVESNGYVV